MISVKLDFNDPEGWRALVPIPFYTSEGLPFWKSLREKNWRPQCTICPHLDIFKDRLSYDRHYAIMHLKWSPDFEYEGWQKFARVAQ